MVVLKGDADLNGSVQNRDATLIRQVLAKNNTLNPETEALQILAVDLNGDNRLQNREATMISQVMAKNNQYTW